MKAHYIIFATLASAALLGFGACAPKEKELTPITTPGNASYESDYGSITLVWSPVADAGQYYYKVENPLQYTVAQGTTVNTYITISSLQPATTYTVYIKAIPKGEDANVNAASDYLTMECTTAAPKQYDFAWWHPATIYWDWDNQVHKSDKAVFGFDKSLQEYVIQSWGGVLGMDVVFSLSDQGEWLIDYAESTAYGGGPDANMAVALYHGIGGTAAANCWFYTNNTGSYFEGNETGGHTEAWMYNPDGDWTGYYLDYGEYTPAPPEPFVPEADAEESWSKDAIASFEGEELGEAFVSFDAESGVYTVYAWYGVEGHDIAFRRDAESGQWILDADASSAYIDGPDEDGVYELSHGKYGKGMASTLYLKPGVDSGYEGDGKNGDLWAQVTDPSGKNGTYVLQWKTDMTPFKWACDIYSNGEKVDGAGTIEYNAETGVYKISSWYGIPGHDVVFTLDENGNWVLDTEASTAYLSGPDGNGAMALSHGWTGDGYSYNCWFYVTANYGWVEGDSSAGTAGCWMYDYQGNWAEYRVEWKAGNWSAEGAVDSGGTDLGTATISYNIETGEYSIDGWYGVPGYGLVFTLNDDGSWNLDLDKSSAYLSGPDGNMAVGLAHGLADAPKANCWYYVNNTGTWFEGGPLGGYTGCWMYNHNGEWTWYQIVWPLDE